MPALQAMEASGVRKAQANEVLRRSPGRSRPEDGLRSDGVKSWLSKLLDEDRIGFVAEHGMRHWRGPLLVKWVRRRRR